ncbi:hypothetical protein PJ262_07480 [Streptococcus dysgalactiae]
MPRKHFINVVQKSVAFSDLYSKSNESSVSKADFLELKRQLAKVKEERDILKKVLTIFAEKKK